MEGNRRGGDSWLGGKEKAGADSIPAKRQALREERGPFGKLRDRLLLNHRRLHGLLVLRAGGSFKPTNSKIRKKKLNLAIVREGVKLNRVTVCPGEKERNVKRSPQAFTKKAERRGIAAEGQVTPAVKGRAVKSPSKVKEV